VTDEFIVSDAEQPGGKSSPVSIKLLSILKRSLKDCASQIFSIVDGVYPISEVIVDTGIVLLEEFSQI
jgi:hypothetical protein